MTYIPGIPNTTTSAAPVVLGAVIKAVPLADWGKAPGKRALTAQVLGAAIIAQLLGPSHPLLGAISAVDL
jgi:hypothetical protein